MTRSFLFLIGILIFSCKVQDGHSHRSPEIYYPVIRIVDGDTFWADNGTPKGIKIRLIGIDAPETRQTGNKPVGYYGEEAKLYLASMLTGASVRLVTDADSLDRYGRTLAYVYLKDGTFVNAALLANGYARTLTIRPNVRYEELFQKLQSKARRQKKGLWGNRSLRRHEAGD